MSLAQYASPYNNDDSGETNTINSNIRMTQSQNQNQNRGKGGGGSGIEKKMPSSSFRKTIKRPLAQQQQKQQQPTLESMQTQSQSRVANLMSKLGAVKSTSYVQGGGDDGSNSSETDLADYQPMNSNDDGGSHDNPKQYQNNQNRGDINYNNDNNDDSVVTRENFENLPSTYASQYYQQYVPLSYGGQQQQNQGDSGLSGSKDDLMQKMNHIIQMLEDQQDEKTGSVTEELILYCFLGVFVIFVVDSFVRAGKYVR
jgi:hypothetical protein